MRRVWRRVRAWDEEGKGFCLVGRHFFYMKVCYLISFILSSRFAFFLPDIIYSFLHDYSLIFIRINLSVCSPLHLLGIVIFFVHLPCYFLLTFSFLQLPIFPLSSSDYVLLFTLIVANDFSPISF